MTDNWECCKCGVENDGIEEDCFNCFHKKCEQCEYDRQ